jgi:hypothetical protein
MNDGVFIVAFIGGRLLFIFFWLFDGGGATDVPQSKKSKKKTIDRSPGISKLRKKSKPNVKDKPSSRSSDRPDASTKVDRGGSYDSRRTKPNRMSFDDKDDKHTEDLPDPNEIF